MNKSFSTETDSKYIKLQFDKDILVIFFICSLIACLGFLISWQLFVFLELIFTFSLIITFFTKRNNEHRWKLEFEEDSLKVINLKTQEEFYVYDIPASDFVINQTKNEIELDYCSLMIKNTVFAFGGVKNCKQLKEYILENFD